MINAIAKLNNNTKDEFEEAKRLLFKIASNIITNPKNLKFRTLQKNNSTIRNKVLNVNGGVDCLLLMGFKEDDETFRLPINTPISTISEFKIYINNLQFMTPKTEEKIIDEKVYKKIVLPPFTPIFSNNFLKRLELNFHNALRYGDKLLLQNAKSLIPLSTFEDKAAQNLRSLQERTKKGKLPEPEIGLQDFLLIELMDWFKNQFFEWMDSPDCIKCGAKTKMSHMSNDKSLLIYTDRVEMHSCDSCKSLTSFPRYNDLNILLETRKGRCGEWANVFTLFCRAMDWDARYVVDETDHVWTEVYSHAQRRWLHCDPCENVCDAPLMYESGWGKKLSYVIAYSNEEIQDVTWRYSGQHKLLLTQRKMCPEQELVDALLLLRNNRQETFSTARKDYLNKRLLNELLELLIERKPCDGDLRGRSSGSLEWRLSRGETQSEILTPCTWILTKELLAFNSVTVQYSCSFDVYEIIGDSNKLQNQIRKWEKGVFKSEGLTRKEEKDWKMIYLCRKESSEIGSISWKFVINDGEKVFDQVILFFQTDLYNDGKIKVELFGDLNSDEIKENTYKSEQFSGSKNLTVKATLSGGNGPVAWQHAQLFRQTLSSQEYPFKVTFTFKKLN